MFDAANGSGLIARVRTNTIGYDECVPSTLGSARRITYADDTATGRSSLLIETPLQALVLPITGNAHSSASYAGSAAQNFIDEARATVRDSISGCSDTRHAVIFGGAGATWASNRLVALLTPRERTSSGNCCSFSGCGRFFDTPAELLAHARRTHADGEASAWIARNTTTTNNNSILQQAVPTSGNSGVVVVVGPFAHHSSFLPWQTAGALIEVVESGEGGTRVLNNLDVALRRGAAKNPKLLIALLTVGSNVTGATIPISQTAALVHSYGGLAIFDGAAAAPHRQLVIDSGNYLSTSALATLLENPNWCSSTIIEPSIGFSTAADALFFSPHKFVGGGAGCPGILIVRRSLLNGGLPAEPGGGTVSFVDRNGIPTFSGDDVAREEAGSPPVAGTARVGLIFRLARAVGWNSIIAREEAMAAIARKTWAAHPQIRILGESAVSPGTCRLPIVSVAIDSHGNGLLHWNFVAAILNDIFGVQARGGCLCAGPYAQELLGLKSPESEALQLRLASEADELLRPGVIRLSFAYSTSHAAFRCIIRALLWVASHGTELLGYYSPDERTGEWRPHRAALRSALLAGTALDMTGKVSTASAIIAAATYDEADGVILADASRGAHRLQPRRWLSSVTFDDEGVHIPHISLRSDISVIGTEAKLIDAYFLEADALINGITANGSGASPAVHDTTGLLSKEGTSLRWFALNSTPLIAAPWQIVNLLQCIPINELDADVSRLNASLKDLLNMDNADISNIAMWDGTDSSSSLSSSSSPRVINNNKNNTVSIVKTRVITLPNTSINETTRPPLAVTLLLPPRNKVDDNNGDDDDSDAGEEDWKVARDATLIFGAAARAESDLPPRLTSLEFAVRRSRLLATTAALAAVIGSPPPALARTLAHGLKEAISQYRMIRHGDRILVGLSGGKDSMTMLLQLLRLQAIAPIYFEVGASTVDPQYAGFDPSPLREWTASIGVPFSFEALDVVALAKEKMGADSLCSFCSRLKRGLLYSACRRRGYNVLALGQHLDDFAESFIMSAFKNGILRTMKAHYTNDKGDIRIIRPLCLVREKTTRAFADVCSLPVIAENCPACFSGPTARYLTKRLLAREEASNGGLYPALLNAMRPLMTTRGSTLVLSAAATLITDADLAVVPKEFLPASLTMVSLAL
jgi:tRNA 2-thiocytidine biosynthesis protein TtcA